MNKLNCVHQMDYWEEKCPHCNGLESCRVPPALPLHDRAIEAARDRFCELCHQGDPEMEVAAHTLEVLLDRRRMDNAMARFAQETAQAMQDMTRANEMHGEASERFLKAMEQLVSEVMPDGTQALE